MAKTVICILMGLTLFVTMSAISSETEQLGKKIFEGEVPVKAKLRHSSFELPSIASKCSNCHSVGPNTEIEEIASPPELGRNRLLTPLKRGSGPPVAYNEESFCIAITKGRTPAHTLLSREMPIFEIDEQTCKALWNYLTGE